jgi:hypothetical protein
VLDGALDNSLMSMDLAYTQAVGLEHALDNYFAWGEAGATRCRWACTGAGAPRTAFDAIQTSVETQALRADRPVGPGEFALGVILPLYAGEDGWTLLSQALAAAKSGDGSSLLQLVDGYLERQPDGSYSNVQDVNNAVNCLDHPTPDYAGVRAQADRFAQGAPHFGLASLTAQLTCSHWPVPSTAPRLPMGHGAPPIVVVGTTGDPATPYEWAVAMSKQLESGVLLTFEGEGHTAYGRGSSCIDRPVETYFNTLEVPRNGCDARAVPQPRR